VSDDERLAALLRKILSSQYVSLGHSERTGYRWLTVDNRTDLTEAEAELLAPLVTDFWDR
jgi:hypothetical protein